MASCAPCACSASGTASCAESTGVCECNANVIGQLCDRCAENFYTAVPNDLSTCRACECNAAGTLACDTSTGACTCKPGVTGASCDTCVTDFFPRGGDLDQCVPCACVPEGTAQCTQTGKVQAAVIQSLVK